MKKAISFCLCILLFISLLPAAAAQQPEDEQAYLASDAPALHLDVEYAFSDDGGVQITLRVLYDFAEPRGLNTALYANDVQIRLYPSNGLVLCPGETDTLAPGTITCGVKVGYSISLQYDPAAVTQRTEDGEIIPRLDIIATDADGNKCEYTALFDVTSKARLFAYAYEPTDWSISLAAEGNITMIQDLYSQTYWNGQPPDRTLANAYFASVQSSFWDELDKMKGWHIDDNDITYIYLNAHGNYRSSVFLDLIVEGVPSIELPDAPPDYKAKPVQYKRIFEYLDKNVPGTVVMLIDSCYSGSFLPVAREMNLDPDRFVILSATTEDDPSGMNTFFMLENGSYGYFTHEIYTYAESVRTGCDTRVITAGELYDKMHEVGQSLHFLFMQLFPNRYSSAIDPVLYGNRDIPVFVFDPNYLYKICPLALKEETVRMDNSHKEKARQTVYGQLGGLCQPADMFSGRSGTQLKDSPYPYTCAWNAPRAIPGVHAEDAVYKCGWFKGRGVLGQMDWDLDGDRKNEWLVAYVTDAPPNNNDQPAALRLAIYEYDQSESRFIPADDVLLSKALDSDALLCKLMVTNTQANRYIVFQHSSLAEYFWVLRYDGELHVETGLMDPGYSSEFILHDLGGSIQPDHIANAYFDGRFSRNWYAGDFTDGDMQAVRQKADAMFAPFGISTDRPHMEARIRLFAPLFELVPTVSHRTMLAMYTVGDQADAPGLCYAYVCHTMPEQIFPEDPQDLPPG